MYSLIDGVESELVEFNSGVCGTELHISEQPDLEELTPQEIGILNIIVDKFKDMSSAEISAMSHKEDAWIKYHDCDNLISYKEAFKLSTNI